MYIVRLLIIVLVATIRTVVCSPSTFDFDEARTALYTVDLDEEPLQLLESTAAGDEQVVDSIHLTSAVGQRFACQIPAWRQPEETPVDSTEDALKNLSVADVAELVDAPFRLKKCIYKAAGWWTFQLCYREAVKQQHVEGVAVTDTLHLGYFERDNEIGTAGQPYFSQTYTGGTLCELNGQLRRTEVRYVCDEALLRLDAVVQRVDETHTCHYLVVVHVGALCQLQPFRPRRAALPAAVVCRPLLDAAQWQRHLDSIAPPPPPPPPPPRLPVNNDVQQQQATAPLKAAEVAGRVKMSPLEYLTLFDAVFGEDYDEDMFGEDTCPRMTFDELIERYENGWLYDDEWDDEEDEIDDEMIEEAMERALVSRRIKDLVEGVLLGDVDDDDVERSTDSLVADTLNELEAVERGAVDSSDGAEASDDDDDAGGVRAAEATIVNTLKKLSPADRRQFEAQATDLIEEVMDEVEADGAADHDAARASLANTLNELMQKLDHVQQGLDRQQQLMRRPADTPKTDDANVKVRLRTVDAKDLQGERADDDVSRKTRQMEESLKERLQQAGFDTRGHRVQVKLITTGAYNADADEFAALGDEESRYVADMIVGALGRESARASERSKHERMRRLYGRRWPDDS